MEPVLPDALLIAMKKTTSLYFKHHGYYSQWQWQCVFPEV